MSDISALADLIGRAVSSMPDGRGGTLAGWLIKPDLLPDAAARAAAAVETRFVLIPRDEYTAEVEAARLRAIADMEHP